MCTRLLHHFVSHQLLVLAAPTKLTFILLLLACAAAGLWLASVYSWRRSVSVALDLPASGRGGCVPV